MIIVITRVDKADCTIDNKIYSSINKGLLLLVGIQQDDTDIVIEKLAKKIASLRIFADDNNKTNLSILDTKGSILSISQFTLAANCKKGNRPSFTNAKEPNEASRLYDKFNNELRCYNINVESGIFGANMKISSINDGPFTIVLDSKEIL